jgi:chromosome segregation ATPase
MLRLDAYRQVFDILINSMTTYKPVLRQIRKHYDAALENAMKTSFENMHLRSEIRLAESKKRKAVDDTLAECARNAVMLRDQLFSQLTGAQVRAENAESEATAAEAAAQDAKKELWLLQARAVELKLENQRLLDQMLGQTSWKPRKSTSGGVVSLAM